MSPNLPNSFKNSSYTERMRKENYPIDGKVIRLSDHKIKNKSPNYLHSKSRYYINSKKPKNTVKKGMLIKLYLSLKKERIIKLMFALSLIMSFMAIAFLICKTLAKSL